MKLVKAHGNAKLVKGPRNPKESKWVKDAQEKDKRDIGAHEQKKTSGHTKPLGERVNGWPKKALQD